MDIVRKEIMSGVFLSCLQTGKFKESILSLNLLTPLAKETASKNAVIPHVLRRGTSSLHDMEAIAAKLDSLYGAVLEPIVRKKGEIQTLGFVADFVDDRYLPEPVDLLEQMAALMGEMLLEPYTRGGLFIKDYVESEKEKLIQQIQGIINEKTSYSLKRLLEQMCYTEPYALSKFGNEEEAENISYVSLSKYYKELLATSPIEIFYCGTADFERVKNALETALINLPRAELNFDLGTDIRLNTVEENVRYYEDTLNVTQGKLAVGFRLGECMMNLNPQAVMMLNAVYGGCTASKLFMNVREKLSLCYFASSRCDVFKGIMYVVSGVSFENFEPALQEIFRQLDEIRAGNISEEEFNAAKAASMSDLLALSDSIGSLEAFWFEQNLLGLEYGPEEAAALLEEVTVEDIVNISNSVVCDAVYMLKGDGEEEEADEED